MNPTGLYGPYVEIWGSCGSGVFADAVGILQSLDVRFEDGYGRTWEDDWKDQFVLMTGQLPVVFSSRK